MTVNELTLGIERMGRLRDFDNLNLLRRQLADVLGVPYDGDISPRDLDKNAPKAPPKGPTT